MALSEREKIDKWTIEERIMSKGDITLWLKYEENEIVDFRWKTGYDVSLYIQNDALIFLQECR